MCTFLIRYLKMVTKPNELVVMFGLRLGTRGLLSNLSFVELERSLPSNG